MRAVKIATWLGALLALWLPLTLIAQTVVQQQNLEDLHLQLSIDRLTLALDERLKYTLVVEVPPTTIVRFQPVDDTLGPFQVVQRHPRGPLRIDEQTQRWQREYVLQPQEQGIVTIPALKVVFFQDDRVVSRTPCISADQCPRINTRRRRYIEIDLADTRRELSTEPVTITVVESQLVAKTDQGTENPSTDADRNIVAGWVFASILALIVLALLWLRRTRQRAKQSFVRNQNQSTVKSLHNHYDSELQALLSLRLDNLIDQQDIEEFYQRLSQIIRDYLSNRFQLATTNTTEELLADAQTGPIAQQYEQLQELLQYCDRVKFARYRSSRYECERMLQSAQTLINQTAQKTQ